MKTETQIAERNVEAEKVLTMEKYKDLMRKHSREHKATCQRFLEFLEYCINELVIPKNIIKPFQVKITDLKQAIKLYDEVGI